MMILIIGFAARSHGFSVKSMLSILLVSVPTFWANIAFAESLNELPSKKCAAYNFDQYCTDYSNSVISKKPILVTKLAKQYKTVITASIKQPVNFAGHYRVVTWGCGTDCRGFAIVNKLTGLVYTLPKVEYVAGVMGNDEDRLQFQVVSKLFIINGVINDEVEGKYYYLFDKERLKLLAICPVKKQDYAE
jgi:hypothetical protein